MIVTLEHHLWRRLLVYFNSGEYTDDSCERYCLGRDAVDAIDEIMKQAKHVVDEPAMRGEISTPPRGGIDGESEDDEK